VPESKALNDLAGEAIILAGSGMCTGGRIRHHLRNRLSRPRDAVIFVGFQARGTLGRLLVDGVQEVTLFGERVPVRAHIYSIEGFSAHADQDGLLHWLQALGSVRQVILNHCEPEPGQAFAELVHARLGLRPQLANLYQTFTV
jgi:metallo-beta-lactamase family protein